MSKRKQYRPVFRCKKCSAYWVSNYDPFCVFCGTVGAPQNKEAQQLIEDRQAERKYFEEDQR